MKRISTFIFAAALLVACSGGNEFDATGTFETETVTIAAEASGRILAFDIEEGQTVTEGQMLCAIDSTPLVLQRRTLEQQQRALLSGRPDSEKQLASLKAQIKKQQNEVTRVQALVKDDAATQKQLDDVQAALSVLQSQYEATLSTLGKNSATIEGNAAVVATQIDQLEYSIAKCRVASPLSGVVLAKYLREGEMAVAGRPLLKVGDLDHIYLRAYFTSDQLSRVKVGQKVKVVADFGGNEQYEYEGTISWIASESEFTPKNIQTRNSRANLVYAAKIAVVNDGRLKIGLYGEVKI
jgi:HlyD family secretion protein